MKVKIWIRKIICFLKFGYWAFNNNDVLAEKTFKMLGEMLNLIMAVANEHKPYLTHICFIHPELGEQSIVSIWAGAGAGAEPIKRIEQLAKEKAVLEQQIKRLLEAKDEVSK